MALQRTLTGGWRGLRANRCGGLSIPVPAPRSRLLSTLHPFKHEQQSQQRARYRSFVPAGLLVGFGLVAAFASRDIAYAEAPAVNLIRLSDVKQHGKDAERKWIIRGIQVYDITDWIPGHPGGDVVSTERSFRAARHFFRASLPVKPTTSPEILALALPLLLL